MYNTTIYYVGMSSARAHALGGYDRSGPRVERAARLSRKEDPARETAAAAAAADTSLTPSPVLFGPNKRALFVTATLSTVTRHTHGSSLPARRELDFYFTFFFFSYNGRKN